MKRSLAARVIAHYHRVREVYWSEVCDYDIDDDMPLIDGEYAAFLRKLQAQADLKLLHAGVRLSVLFPVADEITEIQAALLTDFHMAISSYYDIPF